LRDRQIHRSAAGIVASFAAREIQHFGISLEGRGIGRRFDDVVALLADVAAYAVERGLGTCMQEAWGAVRVSLKKHFELPEHELVYCGMALGYADESAAVNKLRADREPVDGFATFRGF
jgi:nitroreductase